MGVAAALIVAGSFLFGSILVAFVLVNRPVARPDEDSAQLDVHQLAERTARLLDRASTDLRRRRKRSLTSTTGQDCAAPASAALLDTAPRWIAHRAAWIRIIARACEADIDTSVSIRAASIHNQVHTVTFLEQFGREHEDGGHGLYPDLPEPTCRVRD